MQKNYNEMTRSNQLLHTSWKMNKQIRHHIKQTAEKNGLTIAQYSILMMMNRESHMSQKHVQEKTLLPKSTLSQAIDGLVKQGCLTRKQVKDNRREIDLFVSPQGKKFIQEMFIQKDSVHQLFHQAIESLSEQQFKELLNAHELIMSYLIEQGSDKSC